MVITQTNRPSADGRHPSGRKVRADALPENTVYKIESCGYCPNPLACPYTRCICEIPKSTRRLQTSDRPVRVLELALAGIGPDRIACQTHIPRRTVYRLLNRLRQLRLL